MRRLGPARAPASRRVVVVPGFDDELDDVSQRDAFVGQDAAVRGRDLTSQHPAREKKQTRGDECRLKRYRDSEVLERLKQWRRGEATRRGVPAFVIFHDRTLEALSSRKPRDREALRGIKGIGPQKLEDFGEALLSILR